MTLCNVRPETQPQPTAQELWPALPEGVPVLSSFYLYLTTGCNMRCRHCWVSPSFVDGKPDPGDCLPLDLLQRAVKEAKPLGLRHVKLTGGEPLLHPQFLQIVDFLTAQALSLTIETNGTLIDKELARHLKEQATVSHISVSIDGPSAEIHDPFRGVPGSFEAATQGVRHLVAAGFRPQIIASIHRGNLQHLEAIIQKAVELEAGSVKFNPVAQTGRGIGMHKRGETLTSAEVIRLAHRVRGELQQKAPLRLILSTPLAFYTAGELVQRGTDGECHIRHILGILGTGDMALCGIGQTLPDLCFGNLRDTSVADAWTHHPTLQQLREALNGQYPGVCGECIHAHRCLTYCVAQNYLRSGELISPHAMCEEAYRQGQFPASRLRGGQ